MPDWRIKSLYYGELECPKDAYTVGIDVGVKMVFPYIGFLLEGGGKRVLVDTGISERYIVNGRSWGGYAARGGSRYVVEALAKEGLKPEDIDTVLYTHLHHDHAGSGHLFKNSLHIFQAAEWENLCNPLPSQRIRGDYDYKIIDELAGLKCKQINGDTELEPGLKVYLTPGHTKGSMSVAVETTKGTYVITGDTAILKQSLFPKMDKMMLCDGSCMTITPAPDIYGPAIPSSVVYDHYAWYDSINKLKELIIDEKFALTAHDPSVVNKTYPED
jgi:N-acyl homoserine lactone hydrolase